MNYRYMKKPVVIEAFQMTQNRRMTQRDWPKWLVEAWAKDEHEVGALFRENKKANPPDRLCTRTLEGVHTVNWGDWIIRGVKGEIYPCPSATFDLTYEPAPEVEVQQEPPTYKQRPGQSLEDFVEFLSARALLTLAPVRGQGDFAVNPMGFLVTPKDTADGVWVEPLQPLLAVDVVAGKPVDLKALGLTMRGMVEAPSLYIRARVSVEKGQVYEYRRVSDGVVQRKVYPLAEWQPVRFRRPDTGQLIYATVCDVKLPEDASGEPLYQLSFDAANLIKVGRDFPILLPHSQLELVWPTSAVEATAFVTVHDGKRLGWKVTRGLVSNWMPNYLNYGRGEQTPPYAEVEIKRETFTDWEDAMDWCASFPAHPAEGGQRPQDAGSELKQARAVTLKLDPEWDAELFIARSAAAENDVPYDRYVSNLTGEKVHALQVKARHFSGCSAKDPKWFVALTQRFSALPGSLHKEGNDLWLTVGKAKSDASKITRCQVCVNDWIILWGDGAVHVHKPHYFHSDFIQLDPKTLEIPTPLVLRADAYGIRATGEEVRAVQITAEHFLRAHLSSDPPWFKGLFSRASDKVGSLYITPGSTSAPVLWLTTTNWGTAQQLAVGHWVILHPSGRVEADCDAVFNQLYFKVHVLAPPEPVSAPDPVPVSVSAPTLKEE